MTRQIARALISMALAFAVSGVPLVAGGQAPAPAALIGTASNTGGQTLVNAAVQLRNLATGQVAGTTTSNAVGQFSFIGLNPGNYAVEVLNAAGQVVGTSASVTVSAGAAVTGVSVTATAAAAGAAAGGVAAGVAAGAAAGGTAAATGLTTALVIAGAAAAAGVA